MGAHLVLVENIKDWQSGFPDLTVVQARDYLSRPNEYKSKDMRVINLCRGYKYLSTGYYCSLLGEARRHRVIPSTQTITDLSSKAIYSLNVEDLDELVQKVMKRHPRFKEQESFFTHIFFGQCEEPELQEIARQLFELFSAPLLKVEFKRQPRWQIASLKPVSLHNIKPEQVEFFTRGLNGYLSSRWRKRRARTQARFDLAILYNPDEKLPPSNMGALRRFIEAGKKLGVEVELITRKDYNRLAEYDALFIRETTAIDHYTYRFAKKAEAEGMVVIDDTNSIVKCCNKVYLAEILGLNKVPTPRTVILHKGQNDDWCSQVGFPVVLKIPDSAFSKGVFKAEDPASAKMTTDKLFKDSDLILAQEFLYTDFDWRIGILNNQVLFACRYYMTPAHWQIVQYGAGGRAEEGAFNSVPVEDVPSAVIQAAQAAARLIGNGLYGVDLKERDGKVFVMEVNDNPNIESGVEDDLLGWGLYYRIMEEFIQRLEDARRRN